MCWQAILLSIVLLPIIDAPYLYLNKDLYLAATKSISGGRVLPPDIIVQF